MSEFGNIIQIGDILVSEDVVSEWFSCDYEKCRGICCIEGDSGAPIDESELEGLERDYPCFSPLMREQGRKAVRDKGFFELDIEGDIVTPTVPGSDECAYCHFAEDGSCLCSIEKCGRVKPESCRLYPIRVTRLTGGGLALNLHRWKICECAFEKGRREGVRAYAFLRKPICDVFGDEFYEALEAAAKHLGYE